MLLYASALLTGSIPVRSCELTKVLQPVRNCEQAAFIIAQSEKLVKSFLIF
jgi:hypothetical protein